MPPTRIAYSTDGPRITVNAIVRDPKLLPSRMLDVLSDKFVAEQLLRDAGDNNSGILEWFESTPLYPENDPEIVDEFGEIPVAHTQIGTPQFAKARKRALAVLISQEMRDFNRIDLVNKQIRQVKNGMLRSVDGALMGAMLTNAGRNTRVATAAWSLNTSQIRRDVAGAMQQITDQKRDYNPDALVINPSTATTLLTSDEVAKVYTGNAATDNPLLLGRLPGRFFGLEVFVTYQIAANRALVLERKTVGGYSDSRPLQATELYRHNPTETWRSDAVRSTAMFIDEPAAMTEITGIA